MTRVLLVVPTLGSRVNYLAQTLASIADQGVRADIVLVAPDAASDARALAHGAGARWMPDPGSLPAAINLGISTAAPGIEYVTWLGDDDLLTPGSLVSTTAALDSNPKAVLAYGACRYIDAQGRELWESSAGTMAQHVLPWGPQLIPQPGMLVRKSAWIAVGGVDETFRFAFDLDLLLKLRLQGKFVALPEIVSCFRWHADSLTVSDRTTNLDESQRAKRRYLTPGQQRWKWIWEKPVRGATRLAAWEVQRRARKVSVQMDAR
jgi:GT2 family glycosyltransferase